MKIGMRSEGLRPDRLCSLGRPLRASSGRDHALFSVGEERVSPPAWYIFPVTEGDDGPARRCV